MTKPILGNKLSYPQGWDCKSFTKTVALFEFSKFSFVSSKLSSRTFAYLTSLLSLQTSSINKKRADFLENHQVTQKILQQHLQEGDWDPDECFQTRQYSKGLKKWDLTIEILPVQLRSSHFQIHPNEYPIPGTVQSVAVWFCSFGGCDPDPK